MADPKMLSIALVVWTGNGRSPWPDRDEARLVERFGDDVAAELLPQLRHLEDDFYSSDARHTAADLRSMGDKAAEEFHSRHPEIDDDAVEALAWCYTFDYK